MSETNKETLINELVDNKTYIWTTKSRYFPKINDYFLLWKIGNQIVIDPSKIVDSLISAKGKIEETKKEWKKILVIWDKEVFRTEVEDVCNKSDILFLNNKVPSWIFTNFDTFKTRIYSMNKLSKFIQSSSFWKLTKKEQLMKKRELNKLETIYKWVTWLSNVPDLVVVIDAEYNLWTIYELEKANIEYITISNTNLSRWLKTDNLVVANTDSYESITYLLNYLLK